MQHQDSWEEKTGLLHLFNFWKKKRSFTLTENDAERITTDRKITKMSKTTVELHWPESEPKEEGKGGMGACQRFSIWW
jgi:hypothetical protein